jgi:hypothetical protein
MLLTRISKIREIEIEKKGMHSKNWEMTIT